MPLKRYLYKPNRNYSSMELFNNLSLEEQQTLLKFPAYITILASNADGKVDDAEKDAAIDLTHIRSYKSDAKLSSFYKEVEKVFEKNMEELISHLPENKEEKEAAIVSELKKIEAILLKLGYSYTKSMHESMRTFKEHVSNAHNNVLQGFIFPIPIKGITE